MACKSLDGYLIEEEILSHIDKKDRTPVMNTIRLALTGKEDGLPVGDLIAVLGKEEVQRRIGNLVNWMKNEGRVKNNDEND